MDHRQVKMHALVTERPGYKAITRERDRVEHAWGKWAERLSGAERHRAEALTAWHDAQTAALLAGEEPPPRPSDSVSLGDPTVFEAERARLEAAARDLVARESDEIDRDLRKRQAQLMRQASPHARAVTAIAEELEELRRTAEGVRTVAGRAPCVHPTPVRPADVLAAVERGSGFLDEEPALIRPPIELTISRG